TFGGFNRVEMKVVDGKPRLQFTNYLHRRNDPQSLSDNHVFAIYDDKKGNIWLGTRGGGLNKFHKKTGTFTVFKHQKDDPNSISNDYIWDICGDSLGNLWIATDGGLNRMELKTETFRVFVHEPTDPSSLSDNFVNCLKLDTQDRLWVGTNGNGLSIMEDLQRPGTFFHIRKNQGLTHNQIYGIVEDHRQDMWISTLDGISRISHTFTFASQSISSLIQNFDQRDGLQDNEFNSDAYFIAPDGKIYMGGVNGYNSFFPDNIQKNLVPPPVVISHISCNNRSIQPQQPNSDGRILLDQSPAFASQLQLNHKDLVIDIEFAALNYLFPEKNQYAYRLQGLNDTWTFTSDRSRATYTKLPAGNYTFEVKASNNDGVWNETGAKLRISVTPPPWLSGWAYLLYFLTGAALIYLYIQFRISQRAQALQNQIALEQARLQERELVLKNASADYHDELGNKMTKISLFVELAKRQAGVQDIVHTYLQLIESNAQQLSEGMRDFIWMLDPEKNTVFDLASRVKVYAEQLLSLAEITFEIKGLTPTLAQVTLTLTQRRHITLILKEALNNTVKYAQAHHVVLTFHLDTSNLHLYLTDDGKGFDPASVKNGYGLQNMADRAQKIQAQFQLISQLHEGTQIHLSLPIPHMEDRLTSENIAS
ncbi:MAG: two-component regulator propeller domain-containing protein, partial [Bacteroidota bacterium]